MSTVPASDQAIRQAALAEARAWDGKDPAEFAQAVRPDYPSLTDAELEAVARHAIAEAEAQDEADRLIDERGRHWRNQRSKGYWRSDLRAWFKRPACPLTPAARLIAHTILDMADDRTFHCWPGVDEICSQTGLAKNTVQTAIDSLQRYGYIIKLPGRAGRPQRVARGRRKFVGSNVYVIRNPSSWGRTFIVQARPSFDPLSNTEVPTFDDDDGDPNTQRVNPQGVKGQRKGSASRTETVLKETVQKQHEPLRGLMPGDDDAGTSADAGHTYGSRRPPVRRTATEDAA